MKRQCVAIVAAAVWWGTSAVGWAQTNLMSVGIRGTVVDGAEMRGPAVSGDGCVIAFESAAAELVSSDANGVSDVFVRDRCAQPATTELVSRDGTVQGNQMSTSPSVSADGRYVAFASAATNFSAGASNGVVDIFVRDRRAGVTRLASRGLGGVAANGESSEPAISADGRFVAFVSSASNLVPDDTNGLADIFVVEVDSGLTTRVSVSSTGQQGNGSSLSPAISGDGRVVAFTSGARNLVVGDSNDAFDVFVRDRISGTTTRASVAANGGQVSGASVVPAVSGDGTMVAFISSGSLVAEDTNNLPDVYARRLPSGEVRRVSVRSGGGQASGAAMVRPGLSYDGRFVAFLSGAADLVSLDTNSAVDVFVHDRSTMTTVRVHVDERGDQALDGSATELAVDGSGHIVAFTSASDRLVRGDNNGRPDIFVHHWPQFQRTTIGPITEGTNPSSSPVRLTGDGRYVVFASSSDALVSGDTNGAEDIFVHDRVLGRAERVSRGVDGAQSNGPSRRPTISSDGRYVAFQSRASNLVPGDTNGVEDVFVHDRKTHTTTRVTGLGGGQPNGESAEAWTSRTGRYVAFRSSASNLVPLDTNGASDVFVHNRATGETVRASVTTSGQQGTGLMLAVSLSDDASTVAFVTTSRLEPGDVDAMPDLYLHHLGTRRTFRVGLPPGGVPANGGALSAQVNYDGRSVLFSSVATNLVAGDTNGAVDAFVHQVANGTTARVSVNSAGVQTNSHADSATFEANGRYVLFYSTATNLVPDDTNGFADVFLHDTWTATTTRVSIASSGEAANGHSFQGAVSGAGRVVVFASDAPNLMSPGSGPHQLVVRAMTPELLGVWPRAGLASGANKVEIAGKGFMPGTLVTFNGRPAHVFDVWTDRLFVAAPAGSPGEQVTIAVTVPGFPSESQMFAYTYLANPTSDQRDSDSDGATDIAELQFGLDPLDGADNQRDCDNDGQTNAAELAAGTHPCGVQRLFFAEGVTSEFFSTEFALTNPSDLPATALVAFQTATGSRVRQLVTVPPRARRTINAATVPGLARAEFSTVVEADVWLESSRLVRWGDGNGSHEESAALGPRLKWYLAEGATHSGFDLFYLLQNPHDTAVTVVVKYLRPAPQPALERTYTLAPRSRFTVWVNQVAPELASTDISAEITAAQPILVERAMYLSSAGQLYKAGTASAAVHQLEPTWLFAEGATGPYFDLFILLANFKTTSIPATATYLLPDGSTIQKTYTIPGQSRFTIWVDAEDARLADTAVSVKVEVPIKDGGIVAERSMWWPGPTSATWQEAHASAGATRGGWYLGVAGGEQGGRANAETYLLLANLDAFAGRARVTLFFEEGSSISREFDLRPTSRFNVSIAAEFPEASGRRFGSMVESVGLRPANLVVEQAIYSDTPGVRWAAGSNVVATSLD